MHFLELKKAKARESPWDPLASGCVADWFKPGDSSVRHYRRSIG
jgi:hypothetical protein